MSDYLKTFIIAGGTVTGISYLGNQVDPILAGILSGIPISVPSIILISDEGKRKSFLTYAAIMMIICFTVTIFCWYLHIKRGLSKYKSVIYSLLLWIICGGIYYCVLKKNLLKYNNLGI